ncbi:3-hydroxypropionyl-coenzyme A dehydratase [Cladophialophora carrionii]|uniref:3-hydroxypropionyl-coenzyme A dehydratase n=1 Tax=Cladophialophora carrionii TaxID=86049 RepID=A0A1C1CKP8_9EURO|nr:3-hydroxypropionyl-coenzyme A dehydratase [Cladophialophora carrionii]
MLPDPVTVQIPRSYEALPVKDIKVSHYPEGAAEATAVVVVTLNRPKQGNAFTVQMMRDFELVYPMFDLDERVKCIVITGAGKFFCAGADLDIGFPSGGDRERLVDHRDSGGRLNLCIYRCRKPTIVALNGSAVGLGMTLGLSAAIRIAHASSKYGFVFARRGITMESNSSFFLPRLIGHSNALYLLTTGDTYRGDSKHFGSLFQEVLEDQAGVLKRALELATTIAEKTSVLAGFMNRELMWRGRPTAEETHLLDSAVLYHMFANPDCKEGVQSFLEKRSAKFSATLEHDGPPLYPWFAEVDTGSRPRAKASGTAKL